MNKVINPGSNKNGNVFCKISIVNGKLSIVGVEGPKSNGNCKGSCGQIDPLKIDNFKPLWNQELVDKLNVIWDRWHLNDMRAGTILQEKAIREWVVNNRYDYTSACEYLKSINLYEDGDYKYGTAWLKEDLPVDVIDFLCNLPDSKLVPAWV